MDIPCGVVLRRADGALAYRAVAGDVFDPGDPDHRIADVKRIAQRIQAARDSGRYAEADALKPPFVTIVTLPDSTVVLDGGDDAYRAPFPSDYPVVTAEVDWEPAPSWFCDEWGTYTSPQIPTRKLPDGRILVDAHFDSQRGWFIKAFRAVDHEWIAANPWAPKEMKARLRGSDRLGSLRLASCHEWVNKLNAASHAWTRYFLKTPQAFTPMKKRPTPTASDLRTPARGGRDGSDRRTPSMVATRAGSGSPTSSARGQ